MCLMCLFHYNASTLSSYLYFSLLRICSVLPQPSLPSLPLTTNSQAHQQPSPLTCPSLLYTTLFSSLLPLSFLHPISPLPPSLLYAIPPLPQATSGSQIILSPYPLPGASFPHVFHYRHQHFQYNNMHYLLASTFRTSGSSTIFRR